MFRKLRPFNWALAIAFVALALAAAWLVWVTNLIPVRDYPLWGSFLLVFGLFNIVMSRVTGRLHWNKGVRSPKFFRSFWIKLGERGAQIYFLGLGVVLAILGAVLIGQAFYF